MKLLLLSLSALIFLSACDNKKSQNPSDFPEHPKGFRQSDTPSSYGHWFTKDAVADGYEGLSSDRAITQFSLKNSREVIVAVLDSGVDIHHEDLQGKIWVNTNETGIDANGLDKATNQIDDDGNGYIDDVYGWNFIGGANGTHVDYDTLEVTREMVRYESRLAAGEALTPEEEAYFENVKSQYDDARSESEEQLSTMEPEEKSASAAKDVLKQKLGLEDYSKKSLEEIVSTEPDIVEAKEALLTIVTKYRSVERFYRIFNNANNSLNYHLNKSFNSRTIVGDDADDFTQIVYGNNDVVGPDAGHGTHVAGIIAATRNNGIGIDGVAENVKIMVLRVVPNGDERDKDIALAVKYAVANGAHIINMSFGKDFSPHKPMVDEAFLEAAERGVLLFHSAGNSAGNNDVEPGYPNRNVKDAESLGLPQQISTWIEIGASTKDKGLGLVASFSNYGKKDVDIFSPGYELNSTVPGNQYAVYSGTSMASPAAAGAAALMMSNFKAMSGPQAKAIMLNQARPYEGLMVRLPGSAKLDLPVLFSGLSAAGGVVDAFASIALALDLSR